jgi:hypothetical protein
MVRWLRRVLILIALLVAASCGGGTRNLPWHDDFSSSGTGWVVESDSTAEVGPEAGTMRVFVRAPNRLAWVHSEQAFSDFHLAVDARQVAGPDDNEYGVLVRMRDASHFYRFSISGDGYYMVSKYSDDEWIPLSGDWAETEAINRGMAENRIEVVCEGKRMRFMVNGELLAEVEDGSYGQGSIGLYAGTFFEPDVEIRFDDLDVTAP